MTLLEKIKTIDKLIESQRVFGFVRQFLIEYRELLKEVTDGEEA